MVELEEQEVVATIWKLLAHVESIVAGLGLVSGAGAGVGAGGSVGIWGGVMETPQPW